MSAVRVSATIILLLFTLGLVNTDTCSTAWLFEDTAEKMSEKLPTDGDPLSEQDFNKHAATSDFSPKKHPFYLTSLVYSVIEFRHSSVCLLKACLRC
jgi:hypothetical protein